MQPVDCRWLQMQPCAVECPDTVRVSWLLGVNVQSLVMLAGHSCSAMPELHTADSSVQLVGPASLLTRVAALLASVQHQAPACASFICLKLKDLSAVGPLQIDW